MNKTMSKDMLKVFCMRHSNFINLNLPLNTLTIGIEGRVMHPDEFFKICDNPSNLFKCIGQINDNIAYDINGKLKVDLGFKESWLSRKDRCVYQVRHKLGPYAESIGIELGDLYVEI